MKPGAMKTAIIRTAVKRGIKDIKEDPVRGMRNLVELGGTLSNGHFQKLFFDNVFTQLRNEKSAYYRIVKDLVSSVDSEYFQKFGINLGYNALSHGANVIREIEKNEGFNVPWALTFDFASAEEAERTEGSKEAERSIGNEEILNIISQGKTLGIYCYMFYFGRNESELHELLHMLSREKSCAFVLFLDPCQVDEDYCNIIMESKNMFSVIEIASSEKKDQSRAMKLLTERACLSGAYAVQGNLTPDDVNSELLKSTNDLGAYIFISVRKKGLQPIHSNGVYPHFVELRENLDLPVLVIDMFEDYAHADRAISSEACYASILGNGQILFLNFDSDEKNKQYNIHNLSLREAFACGIPKEKKANLGFA